MGGGSRQPRRDPRAIDGPAGDAESLSQRSDVEARIVEQFGAGFVGEETAEVGRGVVGLREMHQMGVAAAVRQLDEAQPVAMGVQPPRLRIHRKVAVERGAVGEVVAMQVNGHAGAALERIAVNGRIRRGVWCPGEDSNFHDLAVTGT